MKFPSDVVALYKFNLDRPEIMDDIKRLMVRRIIARKKNLPDNQVVKK